MRLTSALLIAVASAASKRADLRGGAVAEAFVEGAAVEDATGKDVDDAAADVAGVEAVGADPTEMAPVAPPKAPRPAIQFHLPRFISGALSMAAAA